MILKILVNIIKGNYIAYKFLIYFPYQTKPFPIIWFNIS